MKNETVTVNFKEGLHARPAVKFIKLASSFKSNIQIYKGNDLYSAKSIVSILSACITCGQSITICVEGEDEDEAIAALTKYFEEG